MEGIAFVLFVEPLSCIFMGLVDLFARYLLLLVYTMRLELLVSMYPC